MVSRPDRGVRKPWRRRSKVDLPLRRLAKGCFAGLGYIPSCSSAYNYVLTAFDLQRNVPQRDGVVGSN